MLAGGHEKCVLHNKVFCLKCRQSHSKLSKFPTVLLFVSVKLLSMVEFVGFKPTNTQFGIPWLTFRQLRQVAMLVYFNTMNEALA